MSAKIQGVVLGYLGPPEERLEEGYPGTLFSVVYFSRGTLPKKR